MIAVTTTDIARERRRRRRPTAHRTSIAAITCAALTCAAIAPATSSAKPPLDPCRDSDWMTEAGGIDTGARFQTSLKPTKRARAVGGGRNPLNGNAYVEYIWRDLQRCVRFPTLSRSQRESLFKQLLCHAIYAKTKHKRTGGPTWDLEAWRPNVSKRQALNPRYTCNWGPDNPPPAPKPPDPPPGEGTPPAPGAAKYYFTTWKTALGYRSPTCSYSDPRCSVGSLYAGRNYFYCQTKSSRGHSDQGYRNHWWLFTDLDSPRGAKGWVSAVYVTVGGQEAPIPGLPVC